jgi:hypothetical protein
MYANLGYQPKVFTKFQLNQNTHGWEIVIFVRPKQTTSHNNTQQTWISEGR